MITDFDTYFAQFPPLDREKDFDEFWETSIRELRNTPINATIEQEKKKLKQGFISYNISFKGFNRSTATGLLLVPEKVSKPRIIIIFHDYFRKNHYHTYEFDPSVGYFFLNLKGHEMLNFNQTDEERKTPGYMTDNILDINNYYVREVYLDAYRSIEMLRLRNFLDMSATGIIGKGFGGAMALFAAAYSTRVKALYLDTPSFIHLPISQNLSQSDAAAEINKFINEHRTKSKQVKRNLTYFDALNFSDKITCPTLVTVGFKDTDAPPLCIFGLFNRLQCDKTIEVYPDEGNDAGGAKQFKKALQWMISIITAA
ncbi:MAG: acetylxylan esterase [Spirochaetes bacterium]|nr:acetylxylan esterase [Spirochaetota bacterium]